MPGLLERLVTPRLHASNANDELFWGGTGGNSAAGINVTPELALTYSAFYACIAILAEDESTIPFPAYQRRGDARIPRPDHQVHRLLNDRPNERQTAQEFREWMTAVCAMRGEALAEIVAGRGGFADQLVPMDPNSTRKEVLPNKSVRYQVRDERGQTRDIPADQVFRVPGRLGLSVATLAKETLGGAIAGDRFTSATWKSGIKPRMGLQHPGKLSKEAQDRLAATIDQDHGGAANAGKTVVFEEGMTWVKVGIDPKDAQFLESRQFSVEEVARWFRIPPHKIGHLLRATFSNIEHQGIEYVVDTMRPWCVRWEQAVDQQLITEPDIYARHNLDALLRGDAISRAQANEIRRRNGVISANEWRALDDLNPRDDPGGDVYWDTQPGTGSASGGPPDTKPGSRARALAESAASRVVNRERLAITDRARKHGDNWEAWQSSVREFYEGHASMVGESMCISGDAARAYCEAKSTELVTDGVKACEQWEARDIPVLAALALGGAE